MSLMFSLSHQDQNFSIPIPILWKNDLDNSLRLGWLLIDHPTLQFPISLSDRKWKVKISFWFKLQRLLLHSGLIWYCLPIIAVSEARNWSTNKTQTFGRTVDVAGSCSAIFSSNIDIPCECRWHPFYCCSSNKYEFIKNLWKGIFAE